MKHGIVYNVLLIARSKTASCMNIISSTTVSTALLLCTIIQYAQHHNLSIHVYNCTVTSRVINCAESSMSSFIIVNMTLIQCSKSTLLGISHVRVETYLRKRLLLNNTLKHSQIWVHLRSDFSS